MISRKIVLRESTWNANGMFRLPLCIKGKSATVALAPFFTSKKISSDTTKEASIAVEAMIPPALCGRAFQPRPFIRKPMSGKSGTK
jgi:hypothetical protein